MGQPGEAGWGESVTAQVLKLDKPEANPGLLLTSCELAGEKWVSVPSSVEWGNNSTYLTGIL